MRAGTAALVKKDILANYAGQFWSALMNVAFVPVYVAQLGFESFGLVGVLATLQASFVLLDFGMTPLLGRETARYLSGSHTAFSIRSLLRSVEGVMALLAAFVMALIYGASNWIANHWLGATSFPPSSIAFLLTLMGAIIATRLFEVLYRSALMGLHRQVSLNAGVILTSTLRGLGCVGVLLLISPTIYAYLIWQLLCSVFAVLLFSIMTYRGLPPSGHRIIFSVAAIKNVWRFAVGMTGISVTAVLMTQTDKIILSKILSMSDFGLYSLAVMVAGIPQMLASPVLQALQPRLTAQHAAADELAFANSFHTGAQIVSAILGSASIVLIIFSGDILTAWFHGQTVIHDTATLVSILAAGNLLSGLLMMPYLSQVAYGWTSLTFRWNIVAVTMQVLLLVYMTPRYGALGAAWVWLALNAAGFAFVAAVMFRRIFASERRAWLLTDIVRPLLAALCVAAVAKWLVPDAMSLYVRIAFLAAVSGIVLIAAAAASPTILTLLRHYQARLRFAAR
jgi:O-antigen/teichoic acid export membrane protein